MPRGGHNRLPIKVKELRGTLEPSRENRAAPEGRRGIPKPSRELFGAAKKEYLKLAALLNDMGVLSLGDGGELENLSLARAQIRIIQKMLFESQGDLKTFRKLQICLLDAIRVSAALSARFGLSPSDRARTSVLPEAKKPNRWAKEGEEGPFYWNNYKKE